MTISVAMLISAMNALTFRPPCAACSCAQEEATGLQGCILKGIDLVRNGMPMPWGGFSASL